MITRKRALVGALAGALGLLFALVGIFLGISRLAYAQTPEQAVARYMERVMRGDDVAALTTWVAPGPRGQQARIDALNQRRDLVTKALSSSPPTSYHVVGIEWWRTCCEPGIAEKPEHAGLARVRVALDLPAGSGEYFFDVRKDPSCCMPGDAFDALQFRYWTLLDVYPTTKLPLQFTWIYDQAKRDSHGIPDIGAP